MSTAICKFLNISLAFIIISSFRGVGDGSHNSPRHTVKRMTEDEDYKQVKFPKFFAYQ